MVEKRDNAGPGAGCVRDDKDSVRIDDQGHTEGTGLQEEDYCTPDEAVCVKKEKHILKSDIEKEGCTIL